jgi:hypothetical protein
MKLSSLSPATLEKLKRYRYDWSVEKHEGPWDYELVLKCDDPEFIEINGFNALLPIERKRYPNITVLRCIVSADGETLTLFLKDITYVANPSREFFEAGFVAVCEKFPEEDFFVATLYHEWFIVDNSEATLEERD